MERTGTPRIPGLSEHLGGFVWAESLDLALGTPQSAMWCDDTLVRQMGEALGVTAFGTSALIEAAHRDNLIGDEVALHLQAELVTRRIIGGEFDASVAKTAAGLEGWRPAGAAAYLGWGPPSADGDRRVKFALEAMRHNLADPEAISGWSEAIALWLVRSGGDNHAEGNLVVLLREVLAQTWLTPQALPFVMVGIRNVTRSRAVPDPLERALRSHYTALTAVIEHRVAFDVVRGLVEFMAPDDRSAVTRIVFARES